jgi:uncharacterized protein
MGSLHGNRATPAAGSGLTALMRSWPLTSYFLVTFTLSWTWFGLSLGVWKLPLQGLAGGVGTLLGPCLAAFLMTALLSGWPGVLHLLRRIVRWKVSPLWYLVSLGTWPVLLVAAALTMPGAPTAATAPPAGFSLGLLGLLFSILVFGGPLGEEPGWRGFALPGLQQRIGPLAGTLVLGALHAAWHLPIYLLIPGYNGAPPDLQGVLRQFLLFTVGVTAGSVMFTWLFNNSRGSLLIAVLYHASVNSAGIVASATLPSLSVMSVLGTIRTPVAIALALLIIVGTRGRLSYERHRRETAADGPWPQA